MNLSKPFRWMILILDDLTSPEWLPLTFTLLEEAGLDCRFVHTLEGENDPVCLVQSADLFVIDMQWAGVGTYSESRKPLDLASDTPWTNERLQDWIATILNALVLALPASGLEGQDIFPRAAIAENDVGLWLGAMLLRIQPEGRIVFFTSNDAVKDNSLLGALQVYPRADFQVRAKAPTGPITIDLILQGLEVLQRQALRKRPDLLEWVRRDLILKPLLGGVRVESTKPALHSSETRLTFRLEGFFPQFRDLETSALINILAGFIPTEPHVSEWERVLLHDIDHWIDRCGAHSPSKALEGQLVDACESLGRKGKSLLPYIARLSDDFHIEANLLAVRQFIQQTLNGNCTALGQFLEDQNEGTSELECVGCGGRPLAFSLLDFRTVIDALRQNAMKYGGSGGSISARCTSSGLSLTWSDDSTGFADLDTFKVSVLNSLTKGFLRGLPLVLEFAIKYRAQELWVKAGTGWNNLLQTGSNEADKSQGFGMRFVFR